MEFLSGVFAALLLWPIFIIGTLWFWAFCAGVFGWMIFLTEEDSHFFASISLVAFIWLMSSANGFSVLVNPLVWLKWGVVYFAIGSVWSFLKWFSLLHRSKDQQRKLKASYLKWHPDIELVDGKFSDADFPQYAEYLNDQNYLGKNQYHNPIKERSDATPSLTERAGDLTRWIVWWPMSAFWTILNDPIRRIAEALVRVFKGVYTRMALSVFEGEV